MAQDLRSEKEFILTKQKNYLMTFSEYMQKVLYNHKWGYYSAGKVDFSKHFCTFAENRAPLLADSPVFYDEMESLRSLNLEGIL